MKVRDPQAKHEMQIGYTGIYTLPETNMETQKGPCKDYSPFKGGLYGFPC